MGRTALPPEQRHGIRNRLAQHVKRRHGGNRADFVRSIRIAHNTVTGWFNRKKPTVPDAPQLIRIAEEEGLNLNWLLLGEGPELRPVSDASPEGADEETPEEMVRAAVIGELCSRLKQDRGVVADYVPPGDRLLDMLVSEIREDVKLLCGDEDLRAQLREQYLREAEEYERDRVARANARQLLWGTPAGRRIRGS